MEIINLKELLVKAINASIEGGQSIMDVYSSDFSVEYKDDKSPLTLADRNCNEVIGKYLIGTGIPFLSEEGIKIPFEERKDWEYSWLVDPLDGTKEFIKRNGEFTVNIALIHNQNPVLGVIYVPVKEELYFALEGLGSYKINQNTIIDNIEELISQSNRLPINYNRNNYVVVGSRSHMSKATQSFFEEKQKEHGNIEVMEIGSSLKLCMVAEGKADAYARYAPTMEWDTGAGHAIAKYAGFTVKRYNSSDDVIYNKQDLLNPWFLVS
ncbi:MAG: 3'(2'),5'-bisphosphate nucleotidase [Flavobacteriales bacterium]|nr:3'(2'),5'-bisphosphate nucleotidase [Flavobacteriales bacterium]|tara:strand:- start:72734 stop:73534 length:801 start_codon:yes stop_codon:yes gene_type:complete